MYIDIHMYIYICVDIYIYVPMNIQRLGAFQTTGRLMRVAVFAGIVLFEPYEVWDLQYLAIPIKIPY